MNIQIFHNLLNLSLTDFLNYAHDVIYALLLVLIVIYFAFIIKHIIKSPDDKNDEE